MDFTGVTVGLKRLITYQEANQLACGISLFTTQKFDPTYQRARFYLVKTLAAECTQRFTVLLQDRIYS